MLALDACADCTAILDNHEAVTGTRKGEIVIWSMRTGKVNRQLAVGSADTLSRTGVSPAVGRCRCCSNVESPGMGEGWGRGFSLP